NSLAFINAESWLLPAASVLISTWPGFVDGQGSITQRGPMEPGNGLLHVFLAGHLDEAKAFTSPGVTVHHYVGIDHFPKCPEDLRKLRIVPRITQVSNIDSRGHCWPLFLAGI